MINETTSYGYCQTILEDCMWEPCCIKLLIRAAARPPDLSRYYDPSLWNACRIIYNYLEYFEELVHVQRLSNMLTLFEQNNYTLASIGICSNSDIKLLLRSIWFLFDIAIDLPEFLALELFYDQLKEVSSCRQSPITKSVSTFGITPYELIGVDEDNTTANARWSK
jgi:hypothetical protein